MAVDVAGQEAGMSDAPIDGDDGSSGEFPDPDAPPSGAAPGDGSPEHGQGQFAEAYEAVGSERAGVGSIAEEPDPEDDEG